MEPRVFRAAVLSAVKHDYIARGMASHPRFKLAVVADDAGIPAWAHERNQQFADSFRIPYVRDVDQALRDHAVDVAIVSSEAERHCELSIRALQAGKHVVQDKPLSTSRAEAERLVAAVAKTRLKFLMWNRNFMPAVLQTRGLVQAGAIGAVRAVHVDFYFAKDAGPPRGSRASVTRRSIGRPIRSPPTSTAPTAGSAPGQWVNSPSRASTRSAIFAC